MPSRFICEIHDDIDEAVKVGRIDLIKGLTEEARLAGKRMEAKLQDYAQMKYDFRKWNDLKKQIRQLKSTKEFLDANLDLEDAPDPDENDVFDF